MRSSAKGRETSFCVVEGVASVIANGYLFSYKHTGKTKIRSWIIFSAPLDLLIILSIDGWYKTRRRLEEISCQAGCFIILIRIIFEDRMFHRVDRQNDEQVESWSTIEHTNNLLHDMYPKMDPLPVHTFSPPFTPIFRDRVSCCKVSIISKQLCRTTA